MSEHITPTQWRQMKEHSDHQEHRITILKAKVDYNRTRAEAAEAEAERLSDELGERQAMHFEAEAMLVAEQAATARLVAEVERLTDALAERDRRIAAALERLQWAACNVRGCTIPSCVGVHDVRAILRGESGE